MKKIVNSIISLRMTIILLLIFLVGIGSATFIEDKYDTVTARLLVYNAWWFDIVLLLLALNFIGNIKRYKLFCWKRTPDFIFHFAFIILILGAGVTRFTGFEGTMHIRKGEATNIIYSSVPYFRIKCYTFSKGVTLTYEKPLLLSEAVETLHAKSLLIKLNVQNSPLSIYYKKFKKNAVEKAEENSSDALILDVKYKDVEKEVTVFGGADHIANFQDINLDGITLKLAYGEKPIELPFSLYLKEFILERYPGSMSPSSYASEVTLIDKTNNLKEQHRIFMNNVLDYKGYRFYQSSYDMDEKGTILSVNHDFWGTWITYAGYVLLGLGFLLTLLSRNSRYYVLRQKIRKLREMRKIIPAVIILFFSFQLPASNFQLPVNSNHADKFGHLLVQTFDGRFEPVHTLAFDVLHKISRKDNFSIEGKGEMNGMQAFMDMFLNSDLWKSQKIIYIREKSVKDFLGIKAMYASFNDFFDQQGRYKLQAVLENAFRKKPIEQNTFDREIMKVDERVNILMEVFKGSLLKIFPVQGSLIYKWVDWSDSLSMKPLTGNMRILNEDLQLREFNYINIFRLYFTEVFNATKTGDFSRADKICAYIESIQRQSTYSDILPSKSMVNTEIYYNKANIFVFLRNWYGLLSVVLLLLAFIDNLKKKKSKIISYILNIFILLLGIAFLYHTFGLGLRWYLTGHAPWSNGYEALLLIAWGGLLAGFSFVRYSKITTAATAVLASIIFMVAGLSSYDPQLTNLQPVLKSYWLIIHVAVITISYGFLSLGFVLGLINMIIYLFRTTKNAQRTGNIIKELTYINEMNLTIGIFLATLGTFLGGVWANESWGRYWGWDAKETWALAIIVTYAIILHLRLIPSLKSIFIFNVMSILGFGSVIMTFVGVNYYLSKGLHSYASGETPVFPIWAWIMILSVILLMVISWIKEKMLNNTAQSTSIEDE